MVGHKKEKVHLGRGQERAGARKPKEDEQMLCVKCHRKTKVDGGSDLVWLRGGACRPYVILPALKPGLQEEVGKAAYICDLLVEFK